MTDVVIPQQVKVAAFAKRNKNNDRIEQAEEEIRQLEAERNAPPAKPVKEDDNDNDGPEPTDAEERTFKKRYGDLRRHSQKIQHDLQTQLDSIKEQLQKTAAKEMKLPSSEADLAQWMQSYPDVAKIVETIAMKKAKEQSQGIEERLKRIDDLEKQALIDKAEADLMRLHPDFAQIKQDDEFHDWVEQQPKWLQQALYENDTDAVAASRAIDLYKADKGIKTRSNKDDTKDAARSINTRSERNTPSATNKEGVFSESQVDKMTVQQYEANEEAIVASMRNGTFVRDLSGGAR
jgi:hypothetical protein